MPPLRTEVRDGMRIEWDTPIEMADGCTLRADVYRPPDDGQYPVVMSHGPYGKWLHFEDRVGERWEKLETEHPEVTVDTTNKYMVWETTDPERWVPDGYAIVRVDSRGAGRSPGYLDVWSDQEAEDYVECIEWAGRQPWSNGRVGLLGISYYGINQWQVAAKHPDHLAAICPWEGFSDFYREFGRNGGIYDPFPTSWYPRSVCAVQHGMGARGYRSRMTGEWVAGPETLTDEELGTNRADLDEDVLTSELATDEFYTSRTPDLSAIDVPVLSAANWGGHAMHTRGNFEGFLGAGTEEKWLEAHGREHWTEFYTDYGVDLQKRFFGHYLKGEDTGWDDQPRVLLQVRHPGGEFVERAESDWPIPRTDWTRFHLHAEGLTLATAAPAAPGAVEYDALGDGVTFLSEPLDEALELTGPAAATLSVASDTEDTDLFVYLRAFYPDLEEIVFQSTNDPHKPIAAGWLRASHRKLDEERSTDWRPYHPHDERQPLVPGEVYEVDVEIWPTSVVLPAGTRIGVSVRGREYVYPGAEPGDADRGYGSHMHEDPRDRPADVYGGSVTLHSGPDHPASVLLPVIPADD